MITKLVNDTGKIVYADTSAELTAKDIKEGSRWVLNGYFYIAQCSHIEIENGVTRRIIIVKLA